ncbi:redoxin domain-containing protein [candidate division KSB1 bacterium]|nr:redoxin domain-containing protein [candidate division KSB1 bacterium]
MRYAIALIILLSIIACDSTQSEKKQAHNYDVRIEKIDKDKLSGILNNRDGKVLLINVWATWCIPCREEFPALVKLANKYKNSDVEIIGISADFPDEIETKIVPFLKRNDVNFKNYVQNFENDEDLINMLHNEWNGALPATFIFDETGKRVSSLFGKQKFDELEKQINLL